MAHGSIIPFDIVITAAAASPQDIRSSLPGNQSQVLDTSKDSDHGVWLPYYLRTLVTDLNWYPGTDARLKTLQAQDFETLLAYTRKKEAAQAYNNISCFDNADAELEWEKSTDGGVEVLRSLENARNVALETLCRLVQINLKLLCVLVNQFLPYL